MRKYIYLAAVLIAVFAFSGCGGPKDAEPTPTPGVSEQEPPEAEEKATISEYFPFLEKTLYKYEGIGSDNHSQQMYMMYVAEGKAQRFASNKALRATDVFQLENGELRAVFSDIGYYYDNMLGTEDVLNILMLKEPLELGTKWNFDEVNESEITNMAAVVETPSGNYDNVMEVTNTSLLSGYIQIDYYAKDVGLVKTVYRPSEGEETSMVLKELLRNTTMETEVAFFGANSTTGQYETELRPLSVTTNMDLKEYFNDQLKIVPSSDFEPLMPEAAKINSIEPNRAESILNIDISENYVKEMSVGAGIENMVLQSFANTLGNFYGLPNVQITLDGRAYESGHIIKDIGDYWEVEPVLQGD